jgi:hypothetical protein
LVEIPPAFCDDQIEWEVKQPFRFFKYRSDFEIHRWALEFLKAQKPNVEPSVLDIAQARNSFFLSLFLHKAQEDPLMRMSEIEIHDYARQLFEAYGDRAVAQAAQKACSYEEKGDTEEAETWRHIEAVLQLMRGPHVS